MEDLLHYLKNIIKSIENKYRTHLKIIIPLDRVFTPFLPKIRSKDSDRDFDLWLRN